ncbi:Fic/DOC family protein [Isoalcanivorax beigongshangi]|uniref:protein adenylyltransferase n=1 Tax=Isoalcanivorax beigongshangi TaxID=3238810 RepID=A0ABV4AGV1_9GAMM
MTGYEHYDHEQDEDPYLIPGSMCLRNKLCITDTQTLMAVEAEISSLLMAGLVSDPVEASFDLAHLCRIHEALFSPVYDWAGTVRQTEISKGGRLFLPYRLIEEKAEQVFQELHRENLLRGLKLEAFAERAAYYLGRINELHPFREGNGRTQRVLFDQLAELSGFVFCWTAVSASAMAEACRSARGADTDYQGLQRMLGIILSSAK